MTAAIAAFWLVGSWGPGDSTAPNAGIFATPTRTVVSNVAGRDVTQFSFTVDEPYRAYQLRLVPSAVSPQGSGTLIESGSGGEGSVERSVDVTAAELTAAGGTPGANVVKVFVQDLAGNWSP